MKGFLYAPPSLYDEPQLAQLMAQQPALSWLYVEHDYPLIEDGYAVDLTRLESMLALVQRGESVPPERYSVGRLFTESFELRWQRTGRQIALQWLCEGKTPPPETFQEIASFQVEEGHVFLWGTHRSALTYNTDFLVEGHVWIETRVPRPLAYPLPESDTSKHVRLKVHHYNRGGIMQTTRWLALEGRDKR